MSIRDFHHVLKLARTIVDQDSSHIEIPYLVEAIMYWSQRVAKTL